MPKTKLREVLKSEDSNKEKLSYLWEYFKWHTIATIFILLLIVYSVYEVVNRIDYIFHITILSDIAYNFEIEPINDELNELLDLGDEDGEALVSFNEPGMGTQRFVAQLTAADYDIILFDQSQLSNYGHEGSSHEFEVLSDIDEESLTILRDYDYPMAIDASEFPIFDNYETTRDLYVTIPANTENLEQVKEFFSKQGIEIEYVNE